MEPAKQELGVAGNGHNGAGLRVVRQLKAAADVVKRAGGCEMTSAILIALVGLMYFAVAIDQALIQHNAWNGLVWFGYALAQIGLWHVTVQP
jgi:hypothetical protein